MDAPTLDVELTDRAAERIAAILADEPPGSVFRVSVEGGGCSGFQYSFDISQVAASDDLIVEKNGVRAAVDTTSLNFLRGARIDFVDDLMGQSFRVENPNATASCGCGVSFSV